MIFWGYVLSLLYAVACVVLGGVAHKLGLPKRYSRKIVHIMIGAEWIILYGYMGVSYHFLIVCLICTAALLLDYIFKLVPAMSSEGDNSLGTVYYGVAMSALAAVCLFVPDMIIPFGIAVFCTSLGDGAAGLFGQLIKRGNPRILGKKTLIGYLANLLLSFGVVFAFTRLFDFELSFTSMVIVALLSATVELVSAWGLDNILVTFGVAGLSYGLWCLPWLEGYALIFALIWAVVAVVYEHRALSISGIVLAVALAIVSTVAFGNFGFVLLLIYFAASIITDKIKKRAPGKSYPSVLPNKKFKRNMFQVASNGAAAGICALLYAILGNPAFAVGFTAALSEALSDTAASGVGALAKKTFDPFRMRACESGTSGGMSLLGTASSLIFGSALAFLSYALGIVNIWGALVAACAAFFGMVIDSALGSLVQAKFVCKLCGRRLEKPFCCGEPASLTSGIRIIRNSSVNLISNALVCALTILFCIFAL